MDWRCHESPRLESTWINTAHGFRCYSPSQSFLNCMKVEGERSVLLGGLHAKTCFYTGKSPHLLLVRVETSCFIEFGCALWLRLCACMSEGKPPVGCRQCETKSSTSGAKLYKIVTQLHPQRPILREHLPITQLLKSRVCHPPLGLSNHVVGTPVFVHHSDSKATLVWPTCSGAKSHVVVHTVVYVCVINFKKCCACAVKRAAASMQAAPGLIVWNWAPAAFRAPGTQQFPWRWQCGSANLLHDFQSIARARKS